MLTLIFFYPDVGTSPRTLKVYNMMFFAAFLVQEIALVALFDGMLLMLI